MLLYLELFYVVIVFCAAIVRNKLLIKTYKILQLMLCSTAVDTSYTIRTQTGAAER